VNSEGREGALEDKDEYKKIDVRISTLPTKY
jgi:hypothetical protein